MRSGDIPGTALGRRLDSWKEIAEYLGRDRTTVIRWEREAGLPVRRVAGERGRSVFAYTAEIDAWLAGRSQVPENRPPVEVDTPPAAAPDTVPVRRRRPLWLGVAALVVAGAAALAVIDRPWASATVGKATLVDQDIIGFDGAGRELWRHALPHVDGLVRAAGLKVADLDDDGAAEVVAALQFSLRNGGEGHGQVIALDRQGRTRWERTLDDRLRYGDTEFGPAWFPDELLIYRVNGQVRVAVTAHHHTWWPSIVAVYDADGTLSGEFINTGWINRLNATADGRYLLAAGVNNSFGGTALAVLDGVSPAGVSPAEGGDLPACTSCPPGHPHRYFVTPWTELARPAEVPFSGVVQVAADGLIEWRSAQRAAEHGKVPEVIITLSPQLEVVSRAVDDYFAEQHTLLKTTASVRNAGGDWRHPAVREWSPERGWREVR